jgi:hypothetical protein
MTQAVSVRREGDTYQARVFWQNAVRMLDPQSSVQRVGFEHGPKSFDDVWVEHAGWATPIDYEGKPLVRDHPVQMTCRSRPIRVPRHHQPRIHQRYLAFLSRKGPSGSTPTRSGWNGQPISANHYAPHRLQGRVM